MNFISHFLSNDSVFGRLMNRLGILIGANLLFIVTALPIVTAGASLSALYYTMLKTLRGDGNIRLFRTFFKGFSGNFRQATIAWLAALLLFALLALELFWCSQFEGAIALFRFGIMGLMVLLLVILLYLFPVIAAFGGTLRQLVVDSAIFAFGSLPDLLLVLFANVFPVLLTYANIALLPLAAFLWCMIGFAAVAMFCASRMLPRFRPYLGEEERPAPPENSEEKTLEEMTRFGL